MVSRGERPGYRLVGPEEGVWTIDGLAGVSVAAADRWAAIEAARTAIALMLEVDPDAFDLQ